MKYRFLLFRHLVTFCKIRCTDYIKNCTWNYAILIETEKIKKAFLRSDE